MDRVITRIETEGDYRLYERGKGRGARVAKYFVAYVPTNEILQDFKNVASARKWMRKENAKPLKTTEFSPSNYPDIYFPNWFDRENIENYMGRKITNWEWTRLRESDGQADYISEVVSEYVRDFLGRAK